MIAIYYTNVFQKNELVLFQLYNITRDPILPCQFMIPVRNLIKTTLFNLRFTLEPVWETGSICAPVKKGGWGQRENKGDSWVAHVTDGVNVTRTDCILIARLHTIRLGSLWPYRRAKLLKLVNIWGDCVPYWPRRTFVLAIFDWQVYAECLATMLPSL